MRFKLSSLGYNLLKIRRRGRRRQTLLGRRWGWGRAREGGTSPATRTTGDCWPPKLFEDIWSLWSMSSDSTINDHCPCWWAILIVVLHCTVIALSFLNIGNPGARCLKSEYSQMEPKLLKSFWFLSQRSVCTILCMACSLKKHDYVPHCAPIVRI